MGETYEQSEARRRVEYNQQHPRHAKQVKGYEHNVPCPWCGKHNNHTELPKEEGLIVDCDACGSLMTVVKIIRKPIIIVTQNHTTPKPPYEPMPRESWDLQQAELRRVAEANAEIAKAEKESKK
jgi:uncharacterized Zn finger protein